MPKRVARSCDDNASWSLKCKVASSSQLLSLLLSLRFGLAGSTFSANEEEFKNNLNAKERGAWNKQQRLPRCRCARCH
jgi:hypothetical protein